MQKPKIKISVMTTTTTATLGNNAVGKKRKTKCPKQRESFLAFFFVCLFVIYFSVCVFYLLKNIKTFCKSLFTFNFNWKTWKNKVNKKPTAKWKIQNLCLQMQQKNKKKKWSCLNESFQMQSNAINILKKKEKNFKFNKLKPN